MKHLPPALALITLAAAAQAGQGLSYDSLSIGFNNFTNTEAAGHDRYYWISASARLPNSNFVLGASTTLGGGGNTGSIGHQLNGVDSVNISYVFDDVAHFADVVIQAGSNENRSAYVRKNLGNGFEATAGYFRFSSTDDGYFVGLGYSFSKALSLDYFYQRDSNGWPSSSATWVLNSIAVRYNF
ncbi:MAG: hypothetical protein WCJ96_08765 [Verrucomicrobiota bacterium]|jgi:hypothetical protein